jgi:hypothetical protein
MTSLLEEERLAAGVASKRDGRHVDRFCILYYSAPCAPPAILESKRHAAQTHLSGAQCYPPHARDSVRYAAYAMPRRSIAP